MTILDALRMTKNALRSEQKELHRCNCRYREIQKEICDIDSLILAMERTEATRRSTYEKRIRAIRRSRDREVRRRIYMGLRMDPVNAGRRIPAFHSGVFRLTAKRKAGM